jgi:MATE family multidrug resistance protein
MTAPASPSTAEDKPASLLARLLGLSWPVALGRLGVMGMGVADTVMVGQFAPDELAHQALGWAPTSVLLVAGIGMLTGVQVLTARAIGEGRPHHAGAVLRRGLLIAIVAGLAFTVATILFAGPLLIALGVAPALANPAASVAAVLALSLPLHLMFIAATYFLEGLEKPAASTSVMWIANLVNIAANLALTPSFGAVGSAWGTVIARLFLVAALLGWIVVRYRGAGFGVFDKPDRTAPRFGALGRIGAASALSQVFEAGAFSAMTVLAGRIGEQAVSAYQILLNLLAVVFMIAMGIAVASAVLTSEAKGRGDRVTVRRAGWWALGLNSLFMLAAAGAALLFGAWIARAYTADPALIAVLVGAMGLVALILAPDGGQVVIASTLRAMGDNWFPTASHLVSYVLVMPPLAWWLTQVQGRGVTGLLEAILWASVLSLAILMARFAIKTR